MAPSPPEEKEPKPGLNIYVAPAVNPYKLTILCEELGYLTFFHPTIRNNPTNGTHSIPYNAIRIDTAKGEQRSKWYTEINPNGRLPALVHVKEDGDVVKVWESAACMLYIVAVWDKEHKLSYAVESQDYWQVVAWVCFPFRYLTWTS